MDLASCVRWIWQGGPHTGLVCLNMFVNKGWIIYYVHNARNQSCYTNNRYSGYAFWSDECCQEIDSQLKIPMRLLVVWHQWVHGQRGHYFRPIQYQNHSSLIYRHEHSLINVCMKVEVFWSDLMNLLRNLFTFWISNEVVPCIYLRYGFLRTAVLDINGFSGKTAR